MRQRRVFKDCTQSGAAGAKEGALRDQTERTQVQTGSGWDYMTSWEVWLYPETLKK